jgi:hypothetical protein
MCTMSIVDHSQSLISVGDRRSHLIIFFSQVPMSSAIRACIAVEEVDPTTLVDGDVHGRR